MVRTSLSEKAIMATQRFIMLQLKAFFYPQYINRMYFNPFYDFLGHEKAVELLLKSGSDVNADPEVLFWVIFAGNAINFIRNRMNSSFIWI